MSAYDEQIKCHEYHIDPDFWQDPYGVEVAYDTLKFLYIPDHVSAYIASMLAHKVYRYQIDNIRTKEQITHAVMITMGVESMKASAMGVTRLVAPGPDVPMHTPTRPLARA